MNVESDNRVMQLAKILDLLLANPAKLNSLLNNASDSKTENKVPGYTLGEAFETYINFTKQHHPRSVGNVKSMYTRIQRHFGDSFTLKNLDSRAAQIFFDEVLSCTQMRALGNSKRLLSAMWNRLIAWNYVNSNSWKSVMFKKYQSCEIQYISLEQTDQIVSNIASGKFESRSTKFLTTMRDVILLLRLLPLRPIEALQIKRSDIVGNEIEGYSLRVGTMDRPTKNKQTRYIPLNLSTKAEQILLRRISEAAAKRNRELHPNSNIKSINEPDFYLFSKNNIECYSVDFLSKTFKLACKASSLSQFKLYNLRHSIVSDLANKGLPLHFVSAIAGHTDTSTTQRFYLKTNFTAIKNYVTDMNKKAVNN